MDLGSRRKCQKSVSGRALGSLKRGPQPLPRELALDQAPGGFRVTAHVCDVSNESQVTRFREDALAAQAAQHEGQHVDLVFANAGIGTRVSFINDSRERWERVFAINWWGVYYTARAFLPLLIASPEGGW